MGSDTDTEPQLRVVAGAKKDERPPEFRYTDKSKRPAHRQLRAVTIPTWLPWVAQLLEKRDSLWRARLRAEGVQGGKHRRSGIGIGMVLGAFAVCAGLAAGIVFVWNRGGDGDEQNPAPDKANSGERATLPEARTTPEPQAVVPAATPTAAAPGRAVQGRAVQARAVRESEPVRPRAVVAEPEGTRDVTPAPSTPPPPALSAPRRRPGRSADVEPTF
jgi:hypothetical protein